MKHNFDVIISGLSLSACFLPFIYAAEHIGDKKPGEKLLLLNEKWFGRSYVST